LLGAWKFVTLLEALKRQVLGIRRWGSLAR
jgi:hypothetical protein